MSIRNVTLAAGVCLAASLAAFGQPGVGYLFQLPGQNSSNGQIVGYPYAANPLNPSVNTLGPNGTYQIVAKPDASGYYVLGSTLQIANQAFTTFTSVNGIPGQPTAVAASPDGNYVVVGAGTVYVLAASSNSILFSTTTNGTIVGIAISRDSKYAYVLSNGPGASYVSQISLISKTAVGQPLQLSGNATSISFSPLNLLYVTATNHVYEIDPSTLTVTPSGTMTPNATPGPLRFTPDGTTAYFVNTTSNITGGSILQITLATHYVASWPPFNGVTPTPLDDVLVAGNGRVFAVSYSTATLFDVVTSPLGLAANSSLSSIVNVQGVSAAALSNELPSAVYLYLLAATNGSPNIYRINLSTNQVSAQATSAQTGGVMQFVGVPPQTGAGSFIQFNNTQTVAQGATSLPLIARVLDLTGRPVFNLPVSFTTDASNGVVINTPSPTTNADGWVQTTVTAPAAQGTFTITLAAGTANTTFTINVPGVGGGGPGPNGVTQVTIVSGDGQLIATNTSTNNGCNGDPLTVLVTDVNGVPLPGVGVNFSVTSGTGNLTTYYSCDNSNTPLGTTDAHGLARTGFYAQNPASGNDFEADTVVASTPYGSVSFTEIEYATNILGSANPAFPPQITLLTPSIDTSRTVTVAEGSVSQNAVTASIFANSIPQLNCSTSSTTTCPIPGVSIRITSDPILLTSSPYASCQGTTLSDQTGTAHCNVVAVCGAGLGSFPVYFTVGDATSFLGNVIITKGNGQNLSILSGNNQTGSSASPPQFPLVATVTDGCGAAVTGAQVTWKVTQGSATLSSIVSTSGSSGQVSAKVTFGAAAGPVTVTVSLGTSAVATFSLTNQVVVSNMTIVSGNNQSANVSATFPTPLTVQIKDANNNPVAGATVGFAVTSGNASLNPTSAVTDSQGRASTTATASTNPGAIIVTASYASVNATFSLTAVPQGPQVTAASFQNAASFQPGLVPCGLATATGSGLAPGITGTVSGANFFGPLPYTLNGLSLSVNLVPAPIYQLTNANGKQQVTFQTPCEVAPGSNGTVVIQINGATTTVTGVPILQAQPGIFFATGSNGNSYGAVISADDASGYVTALNPAKRGHNYYLIATGLGQLNPATATNSPGVVGQNVVLPIVVGVSDAGVPVFAQIYQPGEIGVYAIGFTIPPTSPTGVDQKLALGVVVNGVTTFANVLLPAVQ
jgi:uncharacterized protein (TIGR03437 family)